MFREALLDDRFSYEGNVVEHDQPVIVEATPNQTKVGYNVHIESRILVLGRSLRSNREYDQPKIMVRVALNYGGVQAQFKHLLVPINIRGMANVRHFPLPGASGTGKADLSVLGDEVLLLLSRLDDYDRSRTMSKVRALADRFDADAILSEVYADARHCPDVRKVASLFSKIFTLIQDGRFEVLNVLMKKAELNRLAPSVFLGILRTTGAVRNRLPERLLFYEKVARELVERGCNVASLMSGISKD